MNQRIKLTKSLLHNAMLKLIKDKPLQKISISELCQEAGINRSTFYKYYGSQYDLFEEMQQKFIEKINAAMRSYTNYSGSSMIERTMLYLNEHLDEACLFYLNNPTSDFYHKKIENIEFRKAIRMFYDNLPNQVQEYFYLYNCAGADEIIRAWLKKDVRESPTEIAAIIVELRKRTSRP